MATSRYFKPYDNINEQTLLDDLAVEAIQHFGEDVYYIPRNVNQYDAIYGSDDQSSYTWAIPIEMYLKTYEGFTGDGALYTKFGLEEFDDCTWSVSMRRFNEEVGSYSTIVRPREGDIIFFPMNGRLFQIKFVNKFEHFYQLGALQTWDMVCELFSYSGETFATGIPEIDGIQAQDSNNVFDFGIQTEDGIPLRDEAGNYLELETYEENVNTFGPEDQEIQNEGDQIIDFSVQNPFSEDPPITWTPGA